MIYPLLTMLPTRNFLTRLHEFYSPEQHGERANSIEAAIERTWREVGMQTRTLEIDRTLIEGTLKVEVSSEGQRLAVHDLKPGQYYVGRYEAWQIRLEFASVSRVHALLTVHAAGFMTICDLWSRNGILFSGYRTSPGRPHDVHSHDTLNLGDAELKFVPE